MGFYRKRLKKGIIYVNEKKGTKNKNKIKRGQSHHHTTEQNFPLSHANSASTPPFFLSFLALKSAKGNLSDLTIFPICNK